MFLCMFCAFCSVLYIVYVLDKYKIFSFSPLRVPGVADLWQSSYTSTLHTPSVETHGKACPRSWSHIDFWFNHASALHILTWALVWRQRREGKLSFQGQTVYLLQTWDDSSCHVYNFPFLFCVCEKCLCVAMRVWSHVHVEADINLPYSCENPDGCSGHSICSSPSPLWDP